MLKLFLIFLFSLLLAIRPDHWVIPADIVQTPRVLALFNAQHACSSGCPTFLAPALQAEMCEYIRDELERIMVIKLKLFGRS